MLRLKASATTTQPGVCFDSLKTELRVVSSVHSINVFWAFAIYLVLKQRQNAKRPSRQGLCGGACETDATSCCFFYLDLIFSFVLHGKNGSWNFFKLTLTSSQMYFSTSLPHLVFLGKKCWFFSPPVWGTPILLPFDCSLFFVLMIFSFHLQAPFGSLLSLWACSWSPSPPAPFWKKICFLFRLLI